MVKKYPQVFLYNSEQLVSSDFIGLPQSCIYDSLRTKTIGNKILKSVLWYDNEWGFAAQVVDLAKFILS